MPSKLLSPMLWDPGLHCQSGRGLSSELRNHQKSRVQRKNLQIARQKTPIRNTEVWELLASHRASILIETLYFLPLHTSEGTVGIGHVRSMAHGLLMSFINHEKTSRLHDCAIAALATCDLSRLVGPPLARHAKVSANNPRTKRILITVSNSELLSPSLKLILFAGKTLRA